MTGTNNYVPPIPLPVNWHHFGPEMKLGNAGQVDGKATFDAWINETIAELPRNERAAQAIVRAIGGFADKHGLSSQTPETFMKYASVGKSTALRAIRKVIDLGRLTQIKLHTRSAAGNPVSIGSVWLPTGRHHVGMTDEQIATILGTSIIKPGKVNHLFVIEAPFASGSLYRLTGEALTADQVKMLDGGIGRQKPAASGRKKGGSNGWTQGGLMVGPRGSNGWTPEGLIVGPITEVKTEEEGEAETEAMNDTKGIYTGAVAPGVFNVIPGEEVAGPKGASPASTISTGDNVIPFPYRRFATAPRPASDASSLLAAAPPRPGDLAARECVLPVDPARDAPLIETALYGAPTSSAAPSSLSPGSNIVNVSDYRPAPGRRIPHYLPPPPATAMPEVKLDPTLTSFLVAHGITPPAQKQLAPRSINSPLSAKLELVNQLFRAGRHDEAIDLGDQILDEMEEKREQREKAERKAELKVTRRASSE